MGCLRLTYQETFTPLNVVYNDLNASDKCFLGDYRYGFQGQEKDDEIKGEGNSVNYKYRMHDPRIGRFFAVDPLAPEYPYNSPYAFSENSTIAFIDLEGLERYYAADGEYLGKYGDSDDIRIVVNDDEQLVRDYFDGKKSYTRYMQNYVPRFSFNMQEVTQKIATNVARTVYKQTVAKDYPHKKYKLEGDRIWLDWETTTSAHMSGSGSDGNLKIHFIYGETTVYANNFYDLYNLMYHEGLHGVNQNANIQEGHLTHAAIYIKQFNHKSWSKTTKDYKKEMRDNFLDYLGKAEKQINNHYKNDEYSRNYYKSKLNSLIKEYNETFETKISKDEDGMYKDPSLE